MEPGERCHMARLSSLITAPVLGIKRYLCVLRCGEGDLNYVMEPTGEKSIRNGVPVWLNPFFLTLGSAESTSGFLGS